MNYTRECITYEIFSVHFCSYEWYRNDHYLLIDANIQMSDTHGTITIETAASLDEGYYQCITINDQGVALSITTCLQRAGKFTINSMMASSNGNMVSGEFPAQRPVTRSFDVLFDLRLNNQLSKQS